MAVNGRRTFLSHFVICLACAGASFFAWQRGVPQMVWASDLSMTTSMIAALFVFSAGQIGRQAWKIDNRPAGGWSERTPWSETYAPESIWENHAASVNMDFGYLAEKLSVRIGLAGTVIGLAMQGKSLMGGASSFGALSTSLYTTAVGVGAASILAVMIFNLNRGLEP